uniref:protein-glutamate methylesterase n=1 Tax=Steinernema glaseri TaxID=37863 RepID=A0A1I7XZH9_9BILA
MPAAFTKAFAERLDKLCRISVKEAEDGDVLRPGLALLAPGGKQMMVDGRGTVKILPGDERLNYKPCVDITFGSAAKSYGDKVLAVVLTGMGADGREGARLLKQGGSQVWAQDEASCVIYGMPMAIAKANLADAVYGLDEIGRHLLLVDGAEPEAIRSILEVDFYTQESRDIQAAKVFESMGGYAPTIGIIGAVMGLIHVMGNLADPTQLGSGIAVAFVATIYGVASANLILLPIANKLKALAMRQSRYREMLLEGLLSIAEGENPRSIELKLQGFME